MCVLGIVELNKRSDTKFRPSFLEPVTLLPSTLTSGGRAGQGAEIVGLGKSTLIVVHDSFAHYTGT